MPIQTTVIEYRQPSYLKYTPTRIVRFINPEQFGVPCTYEQRICYPTVKEGKYRVLGVLIWGLPLPGAG